MATVLLRNISPLGHLDVPLIRREGDPVGQESAGCLEPGEVFKVPAALAGQAPSGTQGTDDWDPGQGLLAQTGNFELVEKEA